MFIIFYQVLCAVSWSALYGKGLHADQFCILALALRSDNPILYPRAVPDYSVDSNIVALASLSNGVQYFAILTLRVPIGGVLDFNLRA